MLKKLFENRTARVVSTAVLLLLALGAIAAAWAAPGRSGSPGTLTEHAPPAHSNSVHNRGPKPERADFGSGCRYGAAVSHWASGKTKDTSHCDAGATQQQGSATKTKGTETKARTAGATKQRDDQTDDGDLKKSNELEQPDAESTPSPSASSTPSG